MPTGRPFVDLNRLSCSILPLLITDPLFASSQSNRTFISTMTDTSSTATSSTPLLTYASTTTTNPNPGTRTRSCHLFSPQNPIPLWYRLYLAIIEPLTSVIAMYQLVFHPRAYLAETTPGALQGYNAHWDTVFNQLALCMMFTVYIESWLFGYKWADRPDKWDSAVRLLLVGDFWFMIATLQGNQWTPPWKWGQFEGANGRLLVLTGVIGWIALFTRVAFLARIGFKRREQSSA